MLHPHLSLTWFVPSFWFQQFASWSVKSGLWHQPRPSPQGLQNLVESSRLVSSLSSPPPTPLPSLEFCPALVAALQVWRLLPHFFHLVNFFHQNIWFGFWRMNRSLSITTERLLSLEVISHLPHLPRHFNAGPRAGVTGSSGIPLWDPCPGTHVWPTI